MASFGFQISWNGDEDRELGGPGPVLPLTSVIRKEMEFLPASFPRIANGFTTDNAPAGHLPDCGH